jgi:hypothetical protein
MPPARPFFESHAAREFETPGLGAVAKIPRMQVTPFIIMSFGNKKINELLTA